MMSKVEKYFPLVGRVLIAVPFIKFATDKIRNWDMVFEWMQYIDVPAPALALGLANAIELIGGILLIVGFRTRWVALIMALYLIPVHFIVHNFWAAEAAERASQIENFGKGMIIIGGLLFVCLHGAGAYSLDARSSQNR